MPSGKLGKNEAKAAQAQALKDFDSEMTEEEKEQANARHAAQKVIDDGKGSMGPDEGEARGGFQVGKKSGGEELMLAMYKKYIPMNIYFGSR